MFARLYPWRWPIWTVYVIAWTYALLSPLPETSHWKIPDLELDLEYLFSKSVHISAYAVLAVLTAWLRAPVRYRFLLMFFVMVHPTITELLQYAIEYLGRTGALLDVGFDHLGIALGVFLAWKWWVEE
jgi:VanZ family protein